MQNRLSSDSGVLSRREFLTAAAGFTVSATALSLSATIQAAENIKWPVSCRDQHLKTAGQADCWSAAKALGAEGVEVNTDLALNCPNLFPASGRYSLATQDGVKKLKAEAAAAGCALTALVMSNRFDERLEQELQCAARLVKAAQELGVRAIRIDVWPHRLKEDEFFPFAVDACKRLCQTADGTNVRFGIENHGKVTNNPEFLQKLFDAVGSPRLGLTLDCANFYWYGHTLSRLYSIYEQFAPRVFHTHCKNIKFPAEKRETQRPMGWEYEKYNCPIYEGDIDFKRLIQILRKGGYEGDLCVEDESLGKYAKAEQAEILRKETAMLKELRA